MRCSRRLDLNASFRVGPRELSSQNHKMQPLDFIPSTHQHFDPEEGLQVNAYNTQILEVAVRKLPQV